MRARHSCCKLNETSVPGLVLAACVGEETQNNLPIIYGLSGIIERWILTIVSIITIIYGYAKPKIKSRIKCMFTIHAHPPRKKLRAKAHRNWCVLVPMERQPLEGIKRTLLDCENSSCVMFFTWILFQLLFFVNWPFVKCLFFCWLTRSSSVTLHAPWPLDCSGSNCDRDQFDEESPLASYSVKHTKLVVWGHSDYGGGWEVCAEIFWAQFCLCNVCRGLKKKKN